MKFVLDENFPLSARNLLEQIGHKVIDIRESKLRGESDYVLFQFCQELKGVFLTTDRDFFHMFTLTIMA